MKNIFHILFQSNKRGQVTNVGIIQRKSLHLVLKEHALAFDVLLVLQLLLALLHVVVKQRGEPETLVTVVAGEAGVALHVHLQFVASLECLIARVTLDSIDLLVNLFQLRRKISHCLANLFGQGCTSEDFG